MEINRDWVKNRFHHYFTFYLEFTEYFVGFSTPDTVYVYLSRSGSYHNFDTIYSLNLGYFCVDDCETELEKELYPLVKDICHFSTTRIGDIIRGKWIK